MRPCVYLVAGVVFSQTLVGRYFKNTSIFCSSIFSVHRRNIITDMKYILFLLLGLCLFSCNENTESKDKALTVAPINISFTDNVNILGNWIMCSSSGNGMMTQFNVCPTVSFLSNGSGFVGSSSLATEHFSWTFEKGKLNIYTTGKVSDATFSDTFYFARISKENNLTNLVISDSKNDTQLYLSK